MLLEGTLENKLENKLNVEFFRFISVESENCNKL